MGRNRPIIVGPYGFSLHDARRTLAHAVDLLLAFPDSTRDAQGPRIRAIAATIGDADVMRLDLEAARRMLGTVWSLLIMARQDRLRAGNLPATATGRVQQLNRSAGGVPKLRVDAIKVGYGGVVGDVQKTRRHHGKPNQAVCLWNVETIEALRREGHPITAGAAGENITVSGLPWSDVTPGVRLSIGTVLCEVSSYAVPCAQNARWFSDRAFSRIHHSNGPYSRVYATVLEPGQVATDDRVILEQHQEPRVSRPSARGSTSSKTGPLRPSAH